MPSEPVHKYAYSSFTLPDEVSSSQQSSDVESLVRVSNAVVNELDSMFHPTDTMLSIAKRLRMVPINLGTQQLERRVCMLFQKGTRRAGKPCEIRFFGFQ